MTDDVIGDWVNTIIEGSPAKLRDREFGEVIAAIAMAYGKTPDDLAVACAMARRVMRTGGI